MQRKPIVIIASVICGIALVAIWLQLRPVPVQIDRAPLIGAAAGAGAVLAEETIQAVHDQGRIVLVTDYDHNHSDRGQDFRWETFQAEIKKHSGITIAAIEIVEPDPNEPMISACPSAAFKAIVEHHTDSAAIIFFIDLPEWAKVAALIPRPVGPKIIAVDNVAVPTMARYSGYFSSGILTALIAAQPSPASAPAAQPKTPREWFDKYYQVYTPQNYESLPE